MQRVTTFTLLMLLAACGASESTDAPTDATAIAEQGAAQDTLANQVEQPRGEYPRERDLDGNRLVIHAPQVVRWDDFERFEAWLAIEFTPVASDGKAADVEYGTAQISGRTKVDLDERLVHITDPAIDAVQFADHETEDTSAWEQIVKSTVIRSTLDVPLDLFLVYLAEDAIDIEPTTGLNTKPPDIVVKTAPALLLFIDDEPVWAPVEQTEVELLANANWPVLKVDDTLYLLDDGRWLTAPAPKGPWTATRDVPKVFSSLPQTAPFAPVHAALRNPAAAAPAPQVIVRSTPTELILIGGEPVLVTIEGADGLEYVENTTSFLFKLDEEWFYLASGRWFTTDALDGKWELATELPDVFRAIPADSPRGAVRASVPGTVEARLALLEAALPREVAVATDAQPDVEVSYAGEPAFAPVGAGGVQRATNSGYDVFLIRGRYYWCHGGAWYVSSGATGPWSPATEIPVELSEIPPESPGYNTTYVTVQSSSPTTVTYVYTSGYTNVYYGYGVTYYGTGWYYPPYIYGGYYYPYYRSYGYGSWYNPATGRYASRSVVYGPYGGYSYTRGYNPRTGRYGYAETAWDGDEWAMHGESYNPRTGVYSHTDGYYDDDRDMADLERTFQRGDDWMTVDRRIDTKNQNVEVSRETSRGGSASAYRDFDGQGGMEGSGTFTSADGRTLDTQSSFQRGEGGSVDVSGSEGGSGTITREPGGSREGSFAKDGQTLTTSTERSGYNTRTQFESSSGAEGTSVSRGANRTTVARDDSGDLYAGHNGNVYKKTDDGWQSRQGGNWQSVESPGQRSAPQVADYSAQLEAASERARTQQRSDGYGQRSSGSWNRSQLDRDYRTRQYGNQRFQQRRSFGGQRSFGGRGGGFRGRR